MIGKRIAHYKILEQLGSGGMGLVYKAEDTRLRSTVALKFLPPELTRDSTARARLEREAQALASLDHPNICTVHALHHAPDGRPFFCMAFYEGQTVQQKIAEGPLDVGEALAITHAACAGLEEAHGKNIIHRDIKPGNIIITKDGTVKLLDFGIARLIDRTVVTRQGTTPGTIHYMSPEQLSDSDVDARSDVFSLGVVLFEMLTGELPFAADRSAAVSYKILNQEPARVTGYRKDVPKSLQKLLDRAMEKKPRNRYGSVRAFRRELELVMGKRRPHRRLRGAVIAAVAVLITGISINTILERRSVEIVTEKRVMILPFTAEAGAQTFGSMIDGLGEVLNSKLTRLDASDDSRWILPAAQKRKRQSDDPADAAGIYGVNLLVRGNIRKSGDSILVDMVLLDAVYEQPLRTATVACASAVPLEWQTELAASVFDMLDVPMTEYATELLNAGGTSVPAAYASYLAGCGLLTQPDQTEAAILQLDRAVQADPEYALAYGALARADWKLYQATQDEGRPARALERCQRALDIEANLATVWITMGKVRNGTRDYEGAVEAFERALELEPVNAEAFVGLATAYERLSRPEDAEHVLEQAIEHRPDYWPLRQELAFLFYRLGRYQDAAAQFERIAKLTPRDFGTYNSLGAFYYLQGQMDDAERMWKTGFNIKRSYGACNNLGTLYYRQKRYSDAARMYEWAVEYSKEDYVLWGNLAQAYSRIPEERHKARDKFDKAIELAEAMRTTDPKNPVTPAFLAGYYADIGDTNLSRERSEEAVELGPENSEVAFRAGHARAMIGDNEKALRWLGRAIENGYPVEEIMQDPELEKLRRDPRFEHLVGSGAADGG